MSMNLTTCHKCQPYLRCGESRCVCVLDGVWIQDHAKAEYCPDGRYGRKDAPPGWVSLPLTVSARPQTPPPAQITNGPGDVVKLVLERLGYTWASNCGCESQRQMMNQLGWWGCWKVRKSIVSWFIEKAKAQNIAVDSKTVWGLMKAVWREQKKS